VELVTTDPSQRARALKTEDGLDIWIVGGGRLAHALLPEIERLILKQNPAVIGSGIPMFNGPFQPQLFRPTHVRQLDSGVRILSFDRLVQHR
jgi:dihydrofolate reductase